MDLELTQEQNDLASVARRFYDDRAPTSLARAFLDGERSPSALRSELGELGWYGVGLADDPFGTVGLCLLAESAGAHVAPTALVDTAVACRLIATAGGAARAATLVAIVDGSMAVSLALLEEDRGWLTDRSDLRLVRDGDGAFIASGRKIGLLHGMSADMLVVVVADRGLRLAFLIDREAPGVSVTPVPDLDPASAPARIDLDHVTIASADTIHLARADLDRALAVGAVASAAEALGAAGRALDLACAYAVQRQQFGRVIGKFQAVQHLLADLHVLRETGYATTLYAAAALDAASDDALEVASIAKAHVSRSARTIAEGALQVFGGVGFTWEHDFHLLHRRVLSAALRFGDAHEHEGRLGAMLAARAVAR
jgi:alkylation response protein AidB-like acyl-CoA dehydrogenase